jgi:hypothetical protein
MFSWFGFFLSLFVGFIHARKVIGSHLCVNHACSTSTRLDSTRAAPRYCPPPGASEHCATKKNRYTALGTFTRETAAAKHDSA